MTTCHLYTCLITWLFVSFVYFLTGLFGILLLRVFLSIYLAALGLSWGIQDLQSSLRRKGCFSWSIWTLSCNMWDLVPWSGIEPRPPALKAWSLSHMKTREVSVLNFESSLYIKDTSLLSNKHFADIFSQSLPYLLIFFTGSFSEQILKFWWSSVCFLSWIVLTSYWIID